ncbi:hypothetical protein AB9P05_07215 [Roseivirga sp. BDSF3-8]|uniref:hypothetical protein n=1 Tax=Roseivirga sp. BDSF3-8 TaxID=3241598 RepID=UPI00353225CA
MRKNVLRWLVLPMSMVLALVLMQRCQFNEEDFSESGQPGPQESAVAVSDELRQKVNLTFVNADKSATNQPYKATIKLNDPAGQVRTAGGQAQASITTDHGLISLALTDKANLPYSFSIDVSSSGFVPQTRTFIISDNKPVAVEVRMIEVDTKMEGISTASGSFPILNGQAQNQIISRTQGASREFFTIRIPAGTRFLDANRQVIPGNNLQINSRLFASSSSAAMDAAPAPLSTPNVFARGGQEPIGSIDSPVPFRSLGMTDVNMWVDGVEVKYFSNAINFEFELDQKTTTGPNGQPLKEGMTVDFWSFDEERDAWVNEGQSMEFRRSEETQKLVAIARVTHLSTWNLDYKGTVCPDLTFNFTAAPGTYKFEIRSASNGQKVTAYAQRNITVGASGTESITLRNLPADLGNLVILVFDSSGNLLESRTFTPCGSFGDIDVTSAQCVNPTNVTVVCSNGASPAGIAIGYNTFPGSATNILGVTNASGQFTACGLLNGSPINLHAFVNTPVSLNGYSWGSNGSNGTISVTVNASGDLTITLPCL